MSPYFNWALSLALFLLVVAMACALFRARRTGQNVPASVSSVVPSDPAHPDNRY